MKSETYKLVCSRCKGTNIETRAWIDPNDDTILDNCSDGDSDDNWCRDCDNHCSFDVIKIEDTQLNLEL